MEEQCNNPYEQQLLAVFESCLTDGEEDLRSDGLSKLCDKLQLDEDGKDMILGILPKSEPVSFRDFRNGLLELLDHSRVKDQDTLDESMDNTYRPKERDSKFQQKQQKLCDYINGYCFIIELFLELCLCNIVTLLQFVCWTSAKYTTLGTVQILQAMVSMARILFPFIATTNIRVKYVSKELFLVAFVLHSNCPAQESRTGEQLSSAWSGNAQSEVMIKSDASKTNVIILGPQHNG